MELFHLYCGTALEDAKIIIGELVRTLNRSSRDMTSSRLYKGELIRIIHFGRTVHLKTGWCTNDEFLNLVFISGVSG